MMWYVDTLYATSSTWHYNMPYWYWSRLAFDRWGERRESTALRQLL
jgi:hypothetical protein